MGNTNVIHSGFELNNKHYNQVELVELAHTWADSEEDYLKDAADLLLQWFNEKEYVVMHTSGTTGPPKQIHLSKTAMVHSAQATAAFFNIGVDSRALLCMSAKFVGGKLMLIRAMLSGWKLDVIKPTSDPLENNSIYYDFVAMVPMQVEHSIAKLNNVGTLIIGGAKVSSVLADQLLNLTTKVYETYGMTETITHIAAKQIGETFFSVLPHADVSVDARGCLVIHAPKLSTEDLVTNDLVRLIDSKTFEWLGRVDNVINSGGVKLYPEQIETKLMPHILQRFFIIGKEDAYFGSKVVLVIEGDPYDFETAIFDSLAKFERPKEIQFVNHFVETESGKIIRNKNYK